MASENEDENDNTDLKLAVERIAREFDRVDFDIASITTGGGGGDNLPEEMTLEWIMFQMLEMFRNKEHCCESNKTTIEIQQEAAEVEQLTGLEALIKDNNKHLIESEQSPGTTNQSPETTALQAQLNALLADDEPESSEAPDEDIEIVEAAEELADAV